MQCMKLVDFSKEQLTRIWLTLGKVTSSIFIWQNHTTAYASVLPKTSFIFRRDGWQGYINIGYWPRNLTSWNWGLKQRHPGVDGYHVRMAGNHSEGELRGPSIPSVDWFYISSIPTCVSYWCINVIMFSLIKSKLFGVRSYKWHQSLDISWISCLSVSKWHENIT